MGTGRRKNGRSELNLLHNHLKFPSYALLTLLSSSNLYKCLKKGMAKKNPPFGGLGPFSQKISEAPLGANDPVISPLPPSIFNPSVTISLLVNSQSPLLCMLASPLQLLQQMRRIFCQLYQSASCLSREERATPGRGGKDAVGGA